MRRKKSRFLFRWLRKRRKGSKSFTIRLCTALILNTKTHNDHLWLENGFLSKSIYGNVERDFLIFKQNASVFVVDYEHIFLHEEVT
mmetsp:Transcript_15854/g.39083  ORF Transcript_15854/g.39083 Transcript_15854/m.39083 type:complete len:86 (-) Transcript_15854:16-273(-)